MQCSAVQCSAVHNIILKNHISILPLNSLQVLSDRFLQWWDRLSHPKTVLFTINPKSVLFQFFKEKCQIWTQLFPVDYKSPRCFKKQDMGKTKKNEPDLKWWTPQAAQAKPHRGKDIENSLSMPRAELRLTSNLLTSLFSLKFQIFFPQAYRGGGLWRKSPLDGAIDFLWKI